MAWECSHDLSSYLIKSLLDESSRIAELLKRRDDLITICELGCGKAIPAAGLVDSLMSQGYRGKVRLILQDLDGRTIETVTKPNIEARLDQLQTSGQLDVIVEYVACSWENIDSFSYEANIILSSECIYRSDLFSSHAAVIARMLSSDGVAVFAAKRYYFGCGGGTIDFCEFLDQSTLGLKSELVEVIENGRSNTREILEIFR